MLRVVISLFLAFVSISCFGQRPYVILVSFDGFRHDYVELYDLPNFKKFIKEGSAARALIPSFPSKTFPNHYTIVTGLYPGNHGLVDNTFYDRSRNTVYSMSQRDKVQDPYYYGGQPLWRLVQQHGMKSASYFWVGSEIPMEGLHPDYFYQYDGSVPFDSRVDKVLEWLSLPEIDRPRFITLYFSSPDHEAHEFGPLSPETRNAVHRADSLLGKLMSGLEKIEIPVNVILVSDHGMREMEMKRETFIFLDEVINTTSKKIEVVSSGTQAHIYVANKLQADSLYEEIKQRERNFRILKKSAYKASWHYDHPRTGDLLLVADPGYFFRDGRNNRVEEEGVVKKFGVHGYDPDVVNDMWGIFYAKGPNVKQGLTIPAFHNVHIYPFIAKILGVPVPNGIDGKEEVLISIYSN